MAKNLDEMEYREFITFGDNTTPRHAIPPIHPSGVLLSTMSGTFYMDVIAPAEHVIALPLKVSHQRWGNKVDLIAGILLICKTDDVHSFTRLRRKSNDQYFERFDLPLFTAMKSKGT